MDPALASSTGSQSSPAPRDLALPRAAHTLPWRDRLPF